MGYLLEVTNRGIPMKNQFIIPSLQQIVNFFNEETINQIALETGFSVRKRKLSSIVFLGNVSSGYY